MVSVLVFCLGMADLLLQTTEGATVIKVQQDAFKNVNKYEDPNHGMEPGKIPRHVIAEKEVLHDWTQELTPSPIEPNIDIFPPKWYPGDIYPKTGHADIDQALNEVMKSGEIFHDRLCAVAVANEGKSKLMGPKWAVKFGATYTALPQEVETGKTSLNLFVKSKGLATGTAGVLSYDINGTDFKVVVMWSVPFDFNFYAVWFNMKVYPKSVATNTALWSHMYYNGGPSRAAWFEREEFGVKVRGVMTDNQKSKLIVWVNADGFNPSGDYDLYTECGYHPGWFGYYCNQECFARGWCWVDKKCSNESHCEGRQVCYSGC